jgi:DNA-binding NtrC family response regulator
MVYTQDEKTWESLRAPLGKRKNFRVKVTNSTKAAARILQDEIIHIMVVDYELSKNSITFLKKMKALRPSVEVIFLSEKVTLHKAIEAMREGAYDFYEVPVDSRLLITVIDKAIEKQELFLEKTELEKKVKETFHVGNIVGRSKAMQHVIDMIRAIATKNVTILISGETGTGKELIASAIHYNSPRSAKPFIKVSCAALSEGVLESELFGHEKGAFTGAVSTRIGRFELANGGTIFLDEIGDTSPNTQVKLLRILQEQEFERVGGNETKTVDIRIIAATHRNLRTLIQEAKFREDLYYRLNVVNIHVPPLRDRPEDIALLASNYIHRLNIQKGYRIKGITKEAMQLLNKYHWPGNVRELENVVEASMALAEGEVIGSKNLPAFLLENSSESAHFYQLPENSTLQEIEDKIIEQTLMKTKGNKTQAAKLLGISLRTLQRKKIKSAHPQ